MEKPTRIMESAQDPRYRPQWRLFTSNIVSVYPALLCLGAISCAQTDSPFTIQRIIVPASETSDSCLADLRGPLLTEEMEREYTLRLSFLQRKSGPVGPRELRDFSILCDRVLPTGTGSTETKFVLPDTKNGVSFDLAIDAYDKSDGKTLVYSGRINNITASDPALRVFMHRAGKQSCFFREAEARAFHSATLLPNGDVLLAGGIGSLDTSAKLSPERRAYAKRSVSLFDPSTLTWKHFPEAMAVPRAFHRAVLLPSKAEGPYQILVIGGITSSDPQKAAVQLQDRKRPFPFSPSADATVAQAMILTYRPPTRSTTASIESRAIEGLESAGLFPALALNSAGTHILVTPGGTGFSTEDKTQGFSGPQNKEPLLIDLNAIQDPKTATSGAFVRTLEPLLRLRAGHASARFGPESYLILGGAMDGPDEEFLSHSAEIIQDQANPKPLAMPGSSDSTAWHRLSEIGLSDRDFAAGTPAPALLWSGGFKIGSGQDEQAFRFTLNPSATALRVIQGSPAQPTISQISKSAAFTTAAYHEATALFDGSILLSGGNVPRPLIDDGESSSDDPATESKKCARLPTKAGGDPLEPTETIFCPLDQMTIYRFDAATGTVANQLTPRMKVRRYGHQVVRLLDNIVLITGGLSIDSEGSVIVLANAELFNPRSGRRNEDYSIDSNNPIGRPAPGLAEGNTEAVSEQLNSGNVNTCPLF